MASLTRRRSFRRKPKKRYAWTGIQLVTPQALPLFPGTLQLSLIGGAGGNADLFRSSNLLVERVVFDINFIMSGESGATPVGCYLTTSPVELTAQIPTTLWQPLTTDPDGFEKRPMWWRQFLLDPGAQGTGYTVAGGTAPFDVNVKRKLVADEALMLMFQGANALVQDVSVTVLARVLVSMGRR